MTRASKKFGACATCGRELDLTFHHLIPRKLHRRKRFQKQFTKQELNIGVELCRKCHRGIHKTYDEMTLGQHFNSIEALRNDPALRKHFNWVAKQKVKN